MSQANYITQTGTEIDPAFFTYSGETKMFQPLYVGKTQPLIDYVEQKKVKPDDMMVVVSLPDGDMFALKQLHLAYHHVGQGTTPNGQSWMVMF